MSRAPSIIIQATVSSCVDYGDFRLVFVDQSTHVREHHREEVTVYALAIPSLATYNNDKPPRILSACLLPLFVLFSRLMTLLGDILRSLPGVSFRDVQALRLVHQDIWSRLRNLHSHVRESTEIKQW